MRVQEQRHGGLLPGRELGFRQWIEEGVVHDELAAEGPELAFREGTIHGDQTDEWSLSPRDHDLLASGRAPAVERVGSAHG